MRSDGPAAGESARDTVTVQCTCLGPLQTSSIRLSGHGLRKVHFYIIGVPRKVNALLLSAMVICMHVQVFQLSILKI